MFYLIHSFLIASMYLSFGKSANVGSVFFPTTLSTSSWAFLCTSGLRTIARINVDRADTVFRKLNIRVVGVEVSALTVSAPPVIKYNLIT